MNIKEAINARHSVRQYEDRPIDSELVARLNQIIEECNEESGLRIQLITGDPACFDNFFAKYGKFKGNANYVALIGREDMPNLDETCGYYGQRIVLEAQMMGLNTCWMAGTYNKGNCKASIADDEKLVCIISIGYGQTQGKPHKSKPLSKLCGVAEADMPDWFREGMDAALKAPTAINMQRFYVTLEDGEPVVTTKSGGLAKIDLGIVKYNFEAASGHKCR